MSYWEAENNQNPYYVKGGTGKFNPTSHSAHVRLAEEVADALCSINPTTGGARPPIENQMARITDLSNKIYRREIAGLEGPNFAYLGATTANILVTQGDVDISYEGIQACKNQAKIFDDRYYLVQGSYGGKRGVNMNVFHNVLGMRMLSTIGITPALSVMAVKRTWPIIYGHPFGVERVPAPYLKSHAPKEDYGSGRHGKYKKSYKRKRHHY
jgi:hypothetical protein